MEDRDRRRPTPRRETATDPLRELLDADLRARLDAGESGEAALREEREKGRAAHEEARARAAEGLAETGEVEEARILEMRRHRADLDAEATASQDVALRMLAGLGVPYSPGRTGARELFEAPPLARAEAAENAGVPLARQTADPMLRALKYGGMAGSLLLGTFGMGALLLRVPPRSLPSSPLLPLAAGLGLSLVGGAYLAVVPVARRAGALAAGRPGTPEARGAMGALRAMTAGMVGLVALVDAKALQALDGARALVDPASVPPFGLTLLVAAALGHAEGYAEEAEGRIAAEGERHAREWREARREDPEVRQAVEALGYADAVEARRKGLGGEIESAGAQLKRLFGEAMAAAGSAPGPNEDEEARLRERALRARLAEARLAAHDRHRPARGGRRDGSEGGAS